MKYVMATDWHDHWDKLPGGLALYTTGMLVPPMATGFLREGVPTTFLLFTRHGRKPLKAWTGKVTEIAHDPSSERIAFRVRLSRTVRFPRKYAELADGWYVEEPETAYSGLW